ncbi:MAG: phosphoribosylglycinamide formyltransferase [Nitrospinota bacterium]
MSDRSTERGKLRVSVLASGRGSNLQALLEACSEEDFPARVVFVASDVPDAPALERARRFGVEAVHFDPEAPDYEGRLAEALEERRSGLICLAGYMRVLGPAFVRRFGGRVLNIHPALLPSFRGLRAQAKALRAGVKVAGCTVHLVDEGVDTGPIVLQAAVPVLEDDTEESLSARILVQEHRIYPLAVRYFAEGRLEVAGRRVRLRGAGAPGGEVILSPLLGSFRGA